MSDDVAAVLAKALGLRNRLNAEPTLQDRETANELCSALTQAGYAVVKVDEIKRLRAELDQAQLRSIEARNPGIDMDEVRRIRGEKP